MVGWVTEGQSADQLVIGRDVELGPDGPSPGRQCPLRASAETMILCAEHHGLEHDADIEDGELSQTLMGEDEDDRRGPEELEVPTHLHFTCGPVVPLDAQSLVQAVTRLAAVGLQLVWILDAGVQIAIGTDTGGEHTELRA